MFRKRKIGEILKKPIWLYHLDKGNDKVLFTGGMHHYEQTSGHLYSMIEKGDCKLYDGLDVYIIPEINPGNFLGLNRCFDTKDIPHEYQFLKILNPFGLAVDFHGDFEDVRFYLYERHKPNLPHLSSKIFSKLADTFPVRGHDKVDRQPEHTLEEFNFELGSDYSITTENPMFYFKTKKEREHFNEYLARTILQCYQDLRRNE